MTTMIAILVQTYFPIFITIVCTAMIIFCIGLYFILKKFASRPTILDADLAAIAGEDIILTQLDLAKAYIEAEKGELAKNILREVINQGSVAQKNEAKQLLKTI